jgi:hypothetical protein
VIGVTDLLNAINWKDSRSAQVLAVCLVGTTLGFLWILNDIAFAQGIIGWIVFVVIGLPVYLLASLIWEKVFLPGREEPLGLALSWKRIAAGLSVALGTLLVASGVYLFVKGL